MQMLLLQTDGYLYLLYDKMGRIKQTVVNIRISKLIMRFRNLIQLAQIQCII